ncbi:P1 family peptidase [Agromyces badenianii]|uniref:DmpA family aminopeptidase n=1 Tax=Agromyces badenianii TaxID=2080742 RepID=UPI000D598B23|nr:P1 family peptidase [Agromyces badenianii]PWC05650.1 aminopeptidase [Agromyces badenianii]
MRASELGLQFGGLERGRLNAITDVPGVLVGHSTVIEGDGDLHVGRGPVRTGVTVIRPHDGEPFSEPVFGGFHRLNGNGEFTGIHWVEESGLVTGDIALTNTHSVGVVRDTLVDMTATRLGSRGDEWFLPLVGETWDGVLNDIVGQHVAPRHVREAWAYAHSGPVAEGSVGGGTGMICHGFKGGIGTSSRVVAIGGAEYTVGVLLQANHGRRERLTIAGVPVGRLIPDAEVPVPQSAPGQGAGSVIGVIATDAPLLPHQCRRLAQRAGLGIARCGAVGEHSSGDLFLAFSTAARGSVPPDDGHDGRADRLTLDALANRAVGQLFDAVVDATEEAVVNAMLGATTMTGRDGATAHAVPHDRLREIFDTDASPERIPQER